MSLLACFEAAARVAAIATPNLASFVRPIVSTLDRGTAAEASDSEVQTVKAVVRSHIVRDGDSLWSLAKQRGISPYAVMAANPQVESWAQLEAEQALVLPAAGRSFPDSADDTTLQPSDRARVRRQASSQAAQPLPA